MCEKKKSFHYDVWSRHYGEWRRRRISEMLREEGVRSVLDFGCGEGKLLAELADSGRFDRLVGVDAHKPAVLDARRRIGSRSNCTIFHGSIENIRNLWPFDAVILQEVIEHMTTSDLTGLAHMIFADLQPSCVLITTPCRDYTISVLKHRHGRRDRAHRFEWTQSELRDWCRQVSGSRYDFRIERVGPERDGLQPSLLASFKRRD